VLGSHGYQRGNKSVTEAQQIEMKNSPQKKGLLFEVRTVKAYLHCTFFFKVNISVIVFLLFLWVRMQTLASHNSL
jgi:hypothetical protein